MKVLGKSEMEKIVDCLLIHIYAVNGRRGCECDRAILRSVDGDVASESTNPQSPPTLRVHQPSESTNPQTIDLKKS